MNLVVMAVSSAVLQLKLEKGGKFLRSVKR